MSAPARSLLVAACAAAIAGGAVVSGTTGQQPPTFRTATEIVPLHVTVTDSQGRLVPDLEREDFIVLDNTRPQELVFFENQVQPVTVVVMLDTSASMTLTLDLLKAAAEQFIIRLLPDDRGQVGAFNDKIELSGRFTSDRDDLIAALKDLDFGNPTRLFDAVAESMNALVGIEGRRVVLMFTDGADTGSDVGQGTVLDRARREEVMIYAIGLESDYFDGVRRVRTRPDRGLKKLADETGGGYFELQKTDDLGPTFTRVAQELHSQYVLGFEPGEPDGKVHKLEVKVRRPGLNARARKSYVATGDRTSSGGER